MSYEYTLGMGATKRRGAGRKPSGRPGSGRRRASGRQGSRRGSSQRQGPSREETLKAISENCGAPCTVELPDPLFFSGTDQRKTQENTRQAKQRGCAFRCLDDKGAHYYCCPSSEPEKTETQEEKRARIAASCGGERCSEPGRKKDKILKSVSPKLSESKNKLFSEGCVLRCEEGGYFYYCCPSREERQEAGPVLPGFAEVTTVDQESGLPWGVILGLLGLGVAGFAGYWFLLRKED